MGILQDFLNRPTYHIHMPYPQSVSLGTIERGLRSKGIRCWGGMIVGKTMLLSVRKPQSRYALYWLRRWGVMGD